MVKLLIGCTGSVATIKIPLIIHELQNSFRQDLEVRLIVTKNSLHFFKINDLPVNVIVYKDEDEWTAWNDRGDPILHIDLGKWADLFLIAPLDANSLAKISVGMCDNLLTSTVRAWEMSKPLIFCPAMNTKMYNHPITAKQISTLTDYGYKMLPVVEKTLVCGDTGLGAMAEVDTIVNHIKEMVNRL